MTNRKPVMEEWNDGVMGHENTLLSSRAYNPPKETKHGIQTPTESGDES
jgi:hypothetical protein